MILSHQHFSKLIAAVIQSYYKLHFMFSQPATSDFLHLDVNAFQRSYKTDFNSHLCEPRGYSEKSGMFVQVDVMPLQARIYLCKYGCINSD